MRIVMLVTIAVTACSGDESSCEELTCVCNSSADCPASFACAANADGTGQVCYPPGRYPLYTACSVDEECHAAAGLTCQDGLGICVARCGGSLPDCPANSLCQGSDCLPHGSLPLHSTCSNSLLCAEGQCIFGGCYLPCNQGYTTAECPADGSYCMVGDEVPSCRIGLPACSVDGDCPLSATEPRVCVQVGSGLGVCRRACDYDVDAAGLYSDSCPIQVGSHPATCAPIGEEDDSACIEAAAAGGADNALCNNGTRLCAVGHVCVSGRCRALCSSVSSCAAGSCQSVAAGFTACLP